MGDLVTTFESRRSVAIGATDDVRCGDDRAADVLTADFSSADESPKGIFTEVGADGGLYSPEVVVKAHRINAVVPTFGYIRPGTMHDRATMVNRYDPAQVEGFIAASEEPNWTKNPAFYLALARRVRAEGNPLAELLGLEVTAVHEIGGINETPTRPSRQTTGGAVLSLV